MRAKNRVESHVDKWLFVLVFFLGVGGIIYLKLNDFAQIWVTAWPVAMMLIYIGDVLFIRRFRVREDVAADNVYYLGFLYTLTSLSLALYLFQQTGGDTSSIITNFGIALATTILGLFGRILINQFRYDPVDIERVSRMELSEASTQLRSVISTVILDIKSLHRSLMQSSAEMIEEAKSSALAAIATSREHLDAHSENLSQVKTASSAAVTSLRSFVKRVDAIEVPPDLVVSKIGRLVDSLTTTVETAERQTQARDADLAQALSVMKSMAVSVEQQIQAQHALTEHVQSFQVWLATMEEVRIATEAAFRALNEDASRHNAMATRMRTSVTNHVEAFDRQVDEEIEQRRRLLEELSKQTTAASDILSRYNRSLEDQLRKIDLLYNRLDTTVVGMLEVVTAKLATR